MNQRSECRRCPYYQTLCLTDYTGQVSEQLFECVHRAIPWHESFFCCGVNAWSQCLQYSAKWVMFRNNFWRKYWLCREVTTEKFSVAALLLYGIGTNAVEWIINEVHFSEMRNMYISEIRQHNPCLDALLDGNIDHTENRMRLNLQPGF